jgi:hypothetical protein
METKLSYSLRTRSGRPIETIEIETGRGGCTLFDFLHKPQNHSRHRGRIIARWQSTKSYSKNCTKRNPINKRMSRNFHAKENGQRGQPKKKKSNKPVRLWSRLVRSGNPWRQAGSPVAEHVRCAINPQAANISEKDKKKKAVKLDGLLSNSINSKETHSDRWVPDVKVHVKTCGICHNVPVIGNWTQPSGEEKLCRHDYSNRHHYHWPSQPMIPTLC